MALNAKQTLALSLLGVPVTGELPVGAKLPIAVDQTVAFSTEFGGAFGGNLTAVVGRIEIAIRLVVTVQTVIVSPVVELNILVLGDTLLTRGPCFERPMTLIAGIRKSASAQTQRLEFTADRLVINDGSKGSWRRLRAYLGVRTVLRSERPSGGDHTQRDQRTKRDNPSRTIVLWISIHSPPPLPGVVQQEDRTRVAPCCWRSADPG